MRFIVALFALLCSLGGTNRAEGMTVGQHIQRTAAILEAGRTVNSVLPSGVKVQVTWMDCPSFDAMYQPLTGDIEICIGVADVGVDTARFVVSHELAHAIIQQLDIPVTGSEEWAADEFATLVAISNGTPGDALAAAHQFEKALTPPRAFDDHPYGPVRARDMECLVRGSTGDDWQYECRKRYRRAVRAWMFLLSAF